MARIQKLRMADARHLGVVSQCKLTDVMCLGWGGGDPKASSNVVYSKFLPGKVLLLYDSV